MTTPTFAELGLVEPIQCAVQDEGYSMPTPIQAQAIPHLLEGRDLLGVAQTGTGKTAAFALPILDRLARAPRSRRPRCPRVLVLTPTRELAAQIGDSFRVYGRHLAITRTVVFGGVSQVPQVRALTRGVDILIATPGRMLDLMNQRHLQLSDIELFVLDEADRMLDMGFLPDIRRIIATLPEKRQTLLFSATMPQDIVRLAAKLLNQPARVDVAPSRPTADRIEQKVLLVRKEDKQTLLGEMLRQEAAGRVLVFTRTKHGASRLARNLSRARIASEAIHSDKTQTARMQALDGFRNGRVRVLVATDIVARGIDVDGITHVFNYDLPMDPENYVHRIGRTARAGASGVAFSFCDPSEKGCLRNIESLLRRRIPVYSDHPYLKAKPENHGSNAPETARRELDPLEHIERKLAVLDHDSIGRDGGIPKDFETSSRKNNGYGAKKGTRSGGRFGYRNQNNRSSSGRKPKLRPRFSSR